MRSNLEDNLAYNLRQWGGRWAGVYISLDGPYTITPDRANVLFFDANGEDRTIVLPSYDNGRYLIIGNTGVSGDLELYSHLSSLVLTLEPGFTVLLISSLDAWKYIGRAGTLGSALPEFAGTRTLSDSTETITSNERTVLVDRSANMTINLPPVASRGGYLVRLIDISTPAPDHTLTLVPQGGDTILGGNPNLGLYHNGAEAPVVELWPVGSNLWVVK